MKKQNNKSVKGRSPFTLRERSIIEIRWCRDGRTVMDIANELGRNKGSVSSNGSWYCRRAYAIRSPETDGFPQTKTIVAKDLKAGDTVSVTISENARVEQNLTATEINRTSGL